MLYILCHLAFYLLYGKKIMVLGTERGIFLFHFLSFCFLVTVSISISYILHLDKSVITGMAVAGMHGIYSLTFLELWALLQGGYLIRVLKFAPNLKGLEELGDRKLNERLISIQKLGLISVRDDVVSITFFGKIISSLLFTVVKLCNLKTIG